MANNSRYSVSFTGATSLLYQEMGRLLPLLMDNNAADLIAQEVRSNEHQIDDREIFMKGIDYSYYYEQEE